ncbi:MAG: prepilin-type N-terminal cleavage/methylation domain-containing protein [Dethiobacteria bacterium]
MIRPGKRRKLWFFWKKDGGFTIVEVMAAAAIMTLVFSALTIVMVTGARNWSQGRQHVEAQQNARWAMDKIIYELYTAAYIRPIEDPSRIYFVRRMDANKYCFYLSGDELFFAQDSTVNSVARGITGLHFEMDEQGLVTVTVSAGDYTIKSSIRPRNINPPPRDFVPPNPDDPWFDDEE